MDDFKKFTEQLLKIYINAESVNDLGIENYFDENISLIETISNPQQSWGDSWTQGAINVVSN